MSSIVRARDARHQPFAIETSRRRVRTRRRVDMSARARPPLARHRVAVVPARVERVVATRARGVSHDGAIARRAAMTTTTLALGLGHVLALGRGDRAWAFERPLAGYARYVDAIDGYRVDRPSDWIEVKGSGNDVFFRDPREVETNAFVEVSSPTSSGYGSVRDLGTPEEAAEKVLDRYLGELMSTRLGVRREKEVVRAREVTGKDGKAYYDVEVRISSYSARNQYGLTAEDRPQSLEWDRTLRAALGTENGKLYELRLQSPTESYARNTERFDEMVDSFRVFEADTPSVRSGFGL